MFIWDSDEIQRYTVIIFKEITYLLRQTQHKLNNSESKNHHYSHIMYVQYKEYKK